VSPARTAILVAGLAIYLLVAIGLARIEDRCGERLPVSFAASWLVGFVTVGVYGGWLGLTTDGQLPAHKCKPR
jgi:hypothetical protein